MAEETELLEFYGAECDHCKMVATFLDRLKAEEGIDVKRYEVWHSSQNQGIYFKYAAGKCKGVPFLVNARTGDFLCGPKTYEAVLGWAKPTQ